MKQTLLITAMIAIIGSLAGCGQNKATASVKSLLTQDAYQKEENWCGQQAHPDLIQGCKNADAANWLMKNPKLLALTTAPEPWPNKDATFFQSVIDATNAKPQLESEEKLAAAKVGGFISSLDVQRAKDKVASLNKAIAAVPDNASNAYQEESNWCGVQLAYQFGENPMFNQKDLGKISPGCDAANKASAPGGF